MPHIAEETVDCIKRELLSLWTLDKMNGFWGRKRENGTEKGTRHCFAPNPPLAGLD